MIVKPGRRDKRKAPYGAIASVLALSVFAVGVVSVSLAGGADRESPSPPPGLIVESDPIVIEPTTVLVRGFEDPGTGERIVCPDGALLQQTIRGVDLPNGGPAAMEDPTCSDGTTPAAYYQLQGAWREHAAQVNGEAPVSSAPYDDGSFVISKTAEDK